MKNLQDTLIEPLVSSRKGSELTDMKDVASKSRKKTGSVTNPYKARHSPHDAEVIRQSASLFDLVNDAIIAKTLDGIITQWNPAAERMFGYKADEIVGRSMNVLFPSDRIKEAEEILARANKGESILGFETVRLCKDGRPLDVSVTVSPLKNESGKIVGSSKILRDVTEFNRVKRQIEEQEALLDKTQDAILIFDLEGRILFWNKGAERIYGWTRSSRSSTWRRSATRSRPPIRPARAVTVISTRTPLASVMA